MQGMIDIDTKQKLRKNKTIKIENHFDQTFNPMYFLKGNHFCLYFQSMAYPTTSKVAT